MNPALARAASEHRSGFRKRCAMCGKAFDAQAWNGLAMVATLSPASVQAHLTVAAEWGIELRICECGTVLATRR